MTEMQPLKPFCVGGIPLNSKDKMKSNCQECGCRYEYIYCGGRKRKTCDVCQVPRRKRLQKEYRKTEYAKQRKRKLDKEYRSRPTVKERRKQWNKDNSKKYNSRSEVKKHRKEYNKRTEVKNRVRKWSRRYARERYKKDPMFRLNDNIKGSIRRSLKGSKNSWHWEGLVGCTVDDLKRHLEKQFKPGMFWDNYGKWHLDHKVPIMVFNFTKPEHEDFKRCWALKNLQPLWGNENFIKNARIFKHFQPSLKIGV